MKKTLAIFFEKSIELGDETFSDDQLKSKWIGNPPTTIEEIMETENRCFLDRLPLGQMVKATCKR